MFTSVRAKTEISFWERFSQLKLNKFKLSSDLVPVKGWIEAVGESVSLLALRNDSFECHPFEESGIEVNGGLINFNTVEQYKQFNKRSHLQEMGKQILKKMENGEVSNDPLSLLQFSVISFADLKKYLYIYWFCFPIVSLSNFVISTEGSISSTLGATSQSLLERALQKWNQEAALQVFFVLKISNGGNLSLLTLSELTKITATGESFYFCFKREVGWAVENFIFYLQKTFPSLTSSSFRLIELCETVSLSRVTKVSILTDFSISNVSFKGWQRNDQGKPGPRVMDLSAQLSPERIAQDALDLNLKLMTWRQFPELDIDRIKSQKVLLFGAGTLGCAVARVLVGWGFKNIDFVDSGSVSHSNPVRQSLFTLADVGKPKAEVAAERLKKIAPGCHSKGHVVTIPMPGHPMCSVEDFRKISSLVVQQDVLFLLTDTRESRWLPTVLSKMYDKLAFNCALGFDSFLALRMGEIEENLGCYFCSDVVAPQDSTRDRSLDQQCTVTRPGLAPIAAGLAVEMLVSSLHGARDIPHQLRGFLRNFTTLPLSAPRFPNCTACSDSVVAKVKEGIDGEDSTLKRILSEPLFLEELSGVESLKQMLEDFDENLILEASDDEEF